MSERRWPDRVANIGIAFLGHHTFGCSRTLSDPKVCGPASGCTNGPPYKPDEPVFRSYGVQQPSLGSDGRFSPTVNHSLKNEDIKKIRQTLENIVRNILTVNADCNFAHKVLYRVRKIGTVRNLLEQGHYYGTNTCGKDMSSGCDAMNIIIICRAWRIQYREGIKGCICQLLVSSCKKEETAIPMQIWESTGSLHYQHVSQIFVLRT